MRLGYQRYVAQGGDWGAIISEVMAIQAPPGLLGIHTNMPGTVPPDVVQLVRTRQPVPPGFSDAQKAAYASLDIFYNHGFGYAEMMNTRPQTIGYALADSPVGMAAFFYEKFATWTYSGGQPEKVLTPDEMLDDITLYLAHQHRHVVLTLLLGRRAARRRAFHGQGNPQDSCRSYGLPRRDLPGTEKLGRALLSQPHLFQRSRQWRTFRCLGTTGTVQQGNPGRVPFAALARPLHLDAGRPALPPTPGRPPGAPCRSDCDMGHRLVRRPGSSCWITFRRTSP